MNKSERIAALEKLATTAKYFGNASTFEELDRIEEQMNLIRAYDELQYQLSYLSDRIIYSGEGDIVTNLRGVNEEYLKRVGDVLREMPTQEKTASPSYEGDKPTMSDLDKVAGLSDELVIYKGQVIPEVEHYLLGYYSNATTDRHTDVLTVGSHEKYLKTLDLNPKLAPPLWYKHDPLTEHKYKAMMWGMEEHFPFMVWPLTDSEYLGLKAYTKDGSEGMSHQFFALEKEQTPFDNLTIIKTYYSIEMTVLANDNAANAGTSYSIF